MKTDEGPGGDTSQKQLCQIDEPNYLSLGKESKEICGGFRGCFGEGSGGARNS